MLRDCSNVVSVLVLTLVLACDDKPTPSASAAPPAPTLGLSVDDRPLPTRSTLALGTAGETSWRITVSTESLSCDALRERYPDRPDTAKGTRVDFWLVHPLAADGTAEDWAVRSAFITDAAGGRGMTTRGAMLEQVSEAHDMVKIHGIDLACSDSGKMIAYTGAVLAKNCGRVELADEPRPQPDLSVTIAGANYVVGGATVRPVGKRYHLRLSRAPHSCGSVFTEGYDSYLDIALEGEPPKLAFASLSGDAFPDSPSGAKGQENFQVETLEPLAGTTATALTLAGQLDLSGYAVTLSGTVRALRCTPTSPATPSTGEAVSAGEAVSSAAPALSVAPRDAQGPPKAK